MSVFDVSAFLAAGHDITISAKRNPQLNKQLTKGERKPVEFHKVSVAPAKGPTKLKKLKKGSPAPRKGKGTKRKASRTDVDLTVAGMEVEPYEFLASGSEIGSEINTPVKKLSKKEKAAIKKAKAAIKKAKATAKLLKGKMGNWNFFQKCCRLLDIPASIPDDVVTARTTDQLAAGKKCSDGTSRSQMALKILGPVYKAHPPPPSASSSRTRATRRRPRSTTSPRAPPPPSWRSSGSTSRSPSRASRSSSPAKFEAAETKDEDEDEEQLATPSTPPAAPLAQSPPKRPSKRPRRK
jgi:hypothetical protein